MKTWDVVCDVPANRLEGELQTMEDAGYELYGLFREDYKLNGYDCYTLVSFLEKAASDLSAA